MQMRKLFIRGRQQQWSRARCRLSRMVALSREKVRRVLGSCMMIHRIETRQRFVSAGAAPAPRRPLSLTSATVTRRKRDVTKSLLTTQIYIQKFTCQQDVPVLVAWRPQHGRAAAMAPDFRRRMARMNQIGRRRPRRLHREQQQRQELATKPVTMPATKPVTMPATTPVTVEV